MLGEAAEAYEVVKRVVMDTGWSLRWVIGAIMAVLIAKQVIPLIWRPK